MVICETEVYVQQIGNNYSLLSHKMHPLTTFFKIHDYFCHSYFSICKTQYSSNASHCFQNWWKHIQIRMMADAGIMLKCKTLSEIE